MIKQFIDTRCWFNRLNVAEAQSSFLTLETKKFSEKNSLSLLPVTSSLCPYISAKNT